MAIPTSTMSARRAGRAKVGRFGVILAAALAWCLAPAAVAQTMFFDGFDGPQLHPRWNTPGPNGSVWSYDFENSMFNLRSVTAQVPGKIWRRRVDLWTSAEYPGDYSVAARVGWETGGPAREIGIQVPGVVLYMSELLAGTPVYYWSLAGGVVGQMPAPVGGFATLSVTRTGATTRALIDGVEIARTETPIPGIPGWVHISMVGDSRQMRPLHVDLVNVIPCPSATILFACAAFASLARRR